MSEAAGATSETPVEPDDADVVPPVLACPAHLEVTAEEAAGEKELESVTTADVSDQAPDAIGDSEAPEAVAPILDEKPLPASAVPNGSGSTPAANTTSPTA